MTYNAQKSCDKVVELSIAALVSVQTGRAAALVANVSLKAPLVAR